MKWDTMLAFMADAKTALLCLSRAAAARCYENARRMAENQGSAVRSVGHRVPRPASDGKGRGHRDRIRCGNRKELYQKRAIASGTYYASPVAAGGHVYFASLADGTVTVLKAGLGYATSCGPKRSLGERTAATPAIADDTLYRAPPDICTPLPSGNSSTYRSTRICSQTGDGQLLGNLLYNAANLLNLRGSLTLLSLLT